jgi:hypothetical protein
VFCGQQSRIQPWRVFPFTSATSKRASNGQNTEHERTYIQGAEVRDGRILASNTDRQVEDRYETAYNLGCGKKKWDGWINVDLHSDIADINATLEN